LKVMRLRFGDCVFDREARELMRGGTPVELTPKAFQLLALLIEARPRPVRHADLRDALWPGTSTGYTSLARLVNVVRKALGDSAARPAFVRTVPRYGYAFAATVVAEAGSASAATSLSLVADDREFLLAEGETLLGRGPECGVRLVGTGVSRVHASVRIGPERAVIEDRGSKNGTWLNGHAIARVTELAEGDEVFIGGVRLVVRSLASALSTRTAPPPRTKARPSP
jgi:DNA-binding winged helix-turn-helix (wHTH) protein